MEKQFSPIVKLFLDAVCSFGKSSRVVITHDPIYSQWKKFLSWEESFPYIHIRPSNFFGAKIYESIFVSSLGAFLLEKKNGTMLRCCKIANGTVSRRRRFVAIDHKHGIALNLRYPEEIQARTRGNRERRWKRL